MPTSPDHQLGTSLRLSRPRGPASRQQLGSMLRDLVGGEPSLLPPLQHLIAQPSFLALDPRSASRAQRLLGRDQLLAELGEIYQPKVLERLRAFLEGYLDLDAAVSAAPDPVPVIGGGAPPPVNPASAAPEILPPGSAPPRSMAAVHDAPSGSGSFAPALPASAAGIRAGRPRLAAAPRSATSGSAGPNQASTAASPASPSSRNSNAAAFPGGISAAAAPRRNLPLVLALGLLAGLGFGVAFRLPALCRPLGLCPAPPSDHPQAASAGSLALARGQQAAAALQKATTLPAYAGALADLERELLRLSGDPLTREQLRQRDQLQATAREGQQRLSEERQEAQMLSQAAGRIDGLSSLPAVQQSAERQAISQLLTAIPERSFARGAAEEQRNRLSALPLAPQVDPEPVASPSEAIAPQAQPAPLPPRPDRVSPSEEGGGPAPYRDQPLF